MKVLTKYGIYFLCLVFMIAYVVIFSTVLSEKYTYSYNIFYIQGKTHIWNGNDGLVVRFNDTMTYDGEEVAFENLSYFGKEVNLVIDNEDENNILKKIELVESSFIYFEVSKNENVEVYKIILEIEKDFEYPLSFFLNGKEIKGECCDNCDKYVLLINNVEEENVLNIKSNKRVQLKSLLFEEV